MIEHRTHFHYRLMLLPYLIGLVVLIALPMLIMVGLAWYRYDTLSVPTFVGFGNFNELTSDPVFAIALKNSLMFIILTVPLKLLVALGLALLFHQIPRRSAWYFPAILTPTIVPDVAYALLWLWVFNPVYGPINLFLREVGLRGVPWLLSGPETGIAVVIMSIFQIGEGFLIALFARYIIRQHYYEQLQLEGAGAWQLFRHVTFPLMAPFLLLVILRDTVVSFQVSFTPALIMTNGGPPPYSTTYLPLFIYDNAFQYLRFGYAAAAATVLFVLTMMIVWLQYRLLKHWLAKGFL